MNSIFKRRSCLSPWEVRQYLNDELSDEQRYEVENHLLDCELCSAAVDSYAENGDFHTFEEDIQVIQDKVNVSTNALSRRRIAWINRAAAIVLLLIIGYAAFRYWSASKHERTFAAFFEPAPNTYITYRSAGPEAPPMPEELAQALEYYDAEAFELSLPHFENYLEEQPDDLRALLLAASAQLQAGQAERAEQYLLRLEARGETFQGQVPWYMALAYLRQGKMAQARSKLEEVLADQASPFREQAKRLLERLKGESR